MEAGTNLIIDDCPQSFLPTYSWEFSSDGSIQNSKNKKLVIDVEGANAKELILIQLWDNLLPYMHWNGHIWYLRNTKSPK